jgi:hypothetical protein
MLELARRWGWRREDAPPDPAVLAYAFPDRIARNRGNGTFQMACGRGAFMDRAEVLSSSPFLVLCELDDRGGDAKVHLAAYIGLEDIEGMFAAEITEATTTEWDRRAEAVRAVRQTRLGKMVIEEGGQSSPREEDVQSALFAGIRQKGVANLPCWTPGLRQLQARICFLHRVLEDDAWPDVSDAALEAHLEDWFEGFTVGMSRWTHLAKLESEYRLIRRKVPVFADPSSRNSVYEIDDCFFRYWFRFVWKNIYLKELERYNVMRDYALRDYEVFSGHALEGYFREKFMEQGRYSRMGGWWDRKGENEIDIVCENEFSNALDFFEVKRKRREINLKALEGKAAAFFAKNPTLSGRKISFSGLSLEDM